jgi:hypothetical protein
VSQILIFPPPKSSTALKRAEELQASMARERELFAQQRATELAKANEALRGCLDALASVPKLDEFLGQVMAAIARAIVPVPGIGIPSRKQACYTQFGSAMGVWSSTLRIVFAIAMA